MSTALGIASVTHVLKDLLHDGLINGDVSDVLGNNVLVTTLPPDRIETATGSELSGLNLFMYQARPNPGWRNEGLPAYDGRGQRVGNPPLALDLHYFMTAYGAEELHADILLGYGMQLLHENPTLPREAIRRSLSAPPAVLPAGLPTALRALATSELAEQVEQIKITPESLSAEEISRFWTAFQAKYRPTAAYKVTVVLIQSRQSVRAALPVQRRLVYALPFRQPVIDRLQSQMAADAPVEENQKILTGHRLIILGNQLANDLVTVSVDGESVPTEQGAVTDSQIIVIIPDTIPSGLHGVQVVHWPLLGDPATEHRGGSSNLAAFVLSPTIDGAVTYANVSGNGAALRTGTLTVSVVPDIRASQRVVVLLNELGPVPGLAYSFQAASVLPSSPPVSAVTIPVQNVRAGKYLVRIQVDGAESSLKIDSNTLVYTTPQVTIT